MARNTTVIPKKTRLSVGMRAQAMTEKMLGKALDVIERELDPRQMVILCDSDGAPILDENGVPKTKMMGGNPAIAMWVVDRLWPKNNGVPPSSLNVDITTMDGVIACATKATQMVLAQEMTVGDAQGLLTYLLQYAQLRAFDQMKELRALVTAFEEQSAVGLGSIDGKLVPQWGKLTTDSKTSNKTPAE